MNFRLLTILLIACALSIAAHAQGSGSTKSGAARPFAVTRTLIGTAVEIKDEGKVLVIADKKGNKHEFKVDAKTMTKGFDKRMKGDDKMMKDYKTVKDDKMMKDDKMTMKKGSHSMSDLPAGQMVKVTYREEDHMATQIAVVTAKK